MVNWSAEPKESNLETIDLGGVKRKSSEMDKVNPASNLFSTSYWCGGIVS